MAPKLLQPNNDKKQPSLFSFFTKKAVNADSTENTTAACSPKLSTTQKDSMQVDVASDHAKISHALVTPNCTGPDMKVSKFKDDSEEEANFASKSKEDDLADSDDSPIVKRRRTLGPASKKVQKKVLSTKNNKSIEQDGSDDDWVESSEGSDDDYSEGSADDDDDDGVVTESEDDYEEKPKRAGQKRPLATGKAIQKLPPSNGSKKAATVGFASTPTCKFIVENNAQKKQLVTVTPSDEKVSYSPSNTTNNDTSVKPTFVLPEGVIGAGSHEHDSFDFLKPGSRRDANGNRPDDCNYNPRTLKVPIKFLNEQTPAMSQWWQFKASNMDTVLFFKVGKFYELFHMDADIGYSELDLIYMKGTKAHSGFPEVSYGKYSSILVSKGYRVARVEQTETPEMLKERNDSKGGKKDKVVLRELCAVMTKGTRTYCHLDDLTLLEEGGVDTVSTSLLVCIKESSPVDQAATDGDSDVVEYGITCIDTVIGAVTLAQFEDDKLRSRLRTFLARYNATEIILEHNSFSEKTLGVIKLLAPRASLEYLRGQEMPSAEDTLNSIRKYQYFGKAEGKVEEFVENWPPVLKAVVGGLKDKSSSLVMCSFGGALWQLRRSLIDYEVLSMGRFYAYIPSDEKVSNDTEDTDSVGSPQKSLMKQMSSAIESSDLTKSLNDEVSGDIQAQRRRMILDEVALTNLEVLVNNYNRTESGSLWSFVNRCKSIGGRRLLRSWLCHPLVAPLDIEKRRVAIDELLTSLASEAEATRSVLKGVPDLERLLARVHSNGIKRSGAADHPDTRAVMYESNIYNMRKIRDFSDVLTGFENVVKIGDIFRSVSIRSPVLRMIIRQEKELNGRFPLQDIKNTLGFFRSIFDEKQAKKDGNIKPKQGVNRDYDRATAEVASIQSDLEEYLREMRKKLGVNDLAYFGSGKDRYQIEVPVSFEKRVPSDWNTKSQKKTHRRYWNSFIEGKLSELIKAEEEVASAQKDTLRSIFERFDSKRDMWSTAATAISMLDALLALAAVSSLPGYVWPDISEKDESGPHLAIVGGRHPMLEYTLSQRGDGSFIPNDIALGGTAELLGGSEYIPRTLLLTGPNMGGKSTLLRQTCLIVILAQLGCKVPADSCKMSPVDRIFTRVGASDRILSGQSTFFVELAETSIILKTATEDSLCILDELGRGTATFDGTAIAHSVVEFLVSRTRCRSLFATHYHLLVEDWEIDPRVRLGHMDCMVSADVGRSAEEVTFLYKLCDGSSPKSYGINVARLAGMPESLIKVALEQSQAFEERAKQDLAASGTVKKVVSVFERLTSIANANLSLRELAFIASELWKRFDAMKAHL